MSGSSKTTKIFDPAEGFGLLSNLWVATDATVVKRGDQWWMYLAGKATDHRGIQLFSASLAKGSPLSAAGWKLTAIDDDSTKIAVLGGQDISGAWDLNGGRHCPSYVKGWDPESNRWVERIYYAGGADNVWGPYTIGYLEWNGAEWTAQSAPVFVASEEWELGSVYEPNLIYADGRWKMWYVAGSNQEDHIVHGYAESPDGRTNWTNGKAVFPPDEKVFDFCVAKIGDRYEAVFSRIWLAETQPPPATGLWWCHARTASPNMDDWSKPIQLLGAEDRGWHSGPWKPSFQYDESDPNKMFVFFDGAYHTKKPGGFPFVLTLGCLEWNRPT